MDAIRCGNPRPEAYDTTAEVLYVEGDTAWVRIPGGAPETPVERSIAAKQGDVVQVRVANGRAWINGNNTAPPTDDTVAVAAHTVATDTKEQVDELEEHFWYDGSGAHVEGESYRNDMKSDGLHIVEKSTGDTVARFGANGSQIGKDGENHFVADYHSIRMMNRVGNAIFEVADERGRDGYAEYVENFTGDGTTKGFRVRYTIASIVSVTVDGNVLPSSDYGFMPADSTVRLQNAPASGAAISIDYKTSAGIYYFTLGSRAADSHRAPLSFAAGTRVEASGITSHAEGYETKATDAYCHAEGLSTTASGSYSHAEGQYTEASGGSSHAQNTHTIAAGSAQTAIGRYNKSDTSSVYGLIMGNGTSQARSNAFGVTWDGDYEFQADGDLATALTAKGWNVAGTGGLVSLKKILTEIINAL